MTDERLREIAREQRLYLVVRRYRGRERVLFMSEDAGLARTSYRQHAHALRDGDVALWECVRAQTLEVTNGGYNRTRW